MRGHVQKLQRKRVLEKRNKIWGLRMTKIVDNWIKSLAEGKQKLKTKRQQRGSKIKAVKEKPIDKNLEGPDRTAVVAGRKIQIAGHRTLQAGNLGAAGLLLLSQVFLKVSDKLFADNKFIDWLERKYANQQIKKGNNNKDKKQQKKAAYLTYYLMWLSLLLGVYAGYNKDKIAEKTKDKIENLKNVIKNKNQEEDEDEKFEDGTFGAYYDKMRSITPLLIGDLIAKEGVRIDKKTGLHIPYLDNKGVWTIGFGSTMLKSGKPVTKDTKPIPTEEAYELARWHLEEGETYFGMYCYDVAYDDVDINDINQALAMGSIMYNSFTKLIEEPGNRNCDERFANLRNLYGEYGRGLTDEMVQTMFTKYPVTAPRSFGAAWLGGQSKQNVANKLGGFLADGPGMYWRRWLEAGLFTGQITPKMLLNCPANGMYEFFKCMGQKKEAFFVQDALGNIQTNNETYKIFNAWLENPVNEKGQSLDSWKRVRDYMPEYALAACDGDVCKLGKKASKKQRNIQKKVEKETYVMTYEEAYNSAIGAYKSKDYESAAKQLELLLADNPNNALLHNDLAATYNHLERYDDAIKHAQEIVRRIGDKSQYAAAQYNAGFAYEQLGDLQKALSNYTLSVNNGNHKVQADVTRVKNKINNKTKNKTKSVSFNEAASRVKKKKANTKETIFTHTRTNDNSRV